MGRSDGGSLDRSPDSASLSIARVRERIRSISDEAELMLWCRSLSEDPRAGARSLGASVFRRLELARADRRRVAALFELRADLFLRGCRHVAGVDEVGVGPLAGPVVSAAVMLPEEVDLPGLDDSKKLSPGKREQLAVRIHEQALGVAVAEVSAVEIDRMNIFRASLEAMRRAVCALSDRVEIDHLMVDARTIPKIATPQTALIQGDSLDGSIAAASIVAKVHRDALMRRLEERHPGYGFDRHMGYGTAEHMSALRRLGASPAHRRSFSPVAAVLGG